MLSERLKYLRGRTGMSQQKLATTAGLSWSMVAQLEQGRRPDLKMSTVVSLARALEIEPTELFAVLLAEGVGENDDRAEAASADRRIGAKRGRPPTVSRLDGDKSGEGGYQSR
jgi:transcriptional regulator with XRE-family HTH domain